MLERLDNDVKPDDEVHQILIKLVTIPRILKCTLMIKQGDK